MALCPHDDDPNKKDQLKAIKDGTYNGNDMPGFANKVPTGDSKVKEMVAENRKLTDLNNAFKKRIEELELRIMELEEKAETETKPKK